MVSKLNTLRKIILGNDLFEKCSNEYVHQNIIKDTINERLKNGLEKRLIELKEKYNICLENCNIDILLAACQLNKKPKLKDYLCINDSCKNRIYYDEKKESMYYDIIKIDCKNVELINKFKKIEEEQSSNFEMRVEIDNEECLDFSKSANNNNTFYYVAYNKKSNILGGICLLSENNKENFIEIALLTSISKLDRSDLNKGIGSLILNKIKKDYENNKNFYCIKLGGRDDAVPFYVGYGFKYNTIAEILNKDLKKIINTVDGSQFIYIFDKLYNLKSTNLKKYIEFAYKNDIKYLIDYYFKNNIYYNLDKLNDKFNKPNNIYYYNCLLPKLLEQGLKINLNIIIKFIYSIARGINIFQPINKSNYNYSYSIPEKIKLITSNKYIDVYILDLLKLLDKHNYIINTEILEALYNTSLTESYNWLKKTHKLELSNEFKEEINKTRKSLIELNTYLKKI